MPDPSPWLMEAIDVQSPYSSFSVPENKKNSFMMYPNKLTTGCHEDDDAPSSSASKNNFLHRPSPQSAFAGGAFKLRPRSNSHPLPEIGSILPPKPLLITQQRTHRREITPHTISPDEPIMHPASSRHGDDDEDNGPVLPPIPTNMPPQAFAPFFRSRSGIGAPCSSPTKKQKRQVSASDRLKLLLSPDTSPSEYSGDSHEEDSNSIPDSPTPAVSSFSKAAPMFPSSVGCPLTPTRDRMPSISNSSNSGKRSLPQEVNNAGQEFQLPTFPSQEASSPFTPRGTQMMQNLCIGGSISPPPTVSSMNSPPPTLSSKHNSASLTPMHNIITGSTHSQPSMLIHQRLPAVPTFSFSPSLRQDNAIALPNTEFLRSNAADSSLSSVRDTIVFSTESTSTPMATPKKSGLRGSSIASVNSPFHSVRGQQRTPIGHQRGSVFEMLPPRNLCPNGRSATSSPVMGADATFTISSPSPFSASPSPRVVPLTVLSQDGSPTLTARTNAPPPYDPTSSAPSPLMKSLDRIAKEDERRDGADRRDAKNSESFSRYLLSPKIDVKMPNILSVQASPMMSDDCSGHHLLPRIKLTPRGKGSFLTARLDRPSPRLDLSGQLDGAAPQRAKANDNDGIAMPRLKQHTRESTQARSRALSHTNQGLYGRGEVVETASAFATHALGDKEAAEMDSLLNGFDERHKAASNDGDCSAGGSESNDEGRPNLYRVESEEAEMVALTSGPWQMPTLYLPPVPERKGDDRLSSPICPNRKPMPSITLSIPSSAGRARSLSLHDADDAASRSPKFLPRTVPGKTLQPKSRSLFDASSARTDPLERILRADAIAEAARSDEPLTDDDSDDDGDEGGFLLCLPQSSSQETDGSQLSGSPKKKNFSFKQSSHGTGSFRSGSPTLSSSSINKPSRHGHFTRRSKCGDCTSSFHSLTSPPAPTIFEEGFATLDKDNDLGHPMSTLEGSLQGLNKRETSDATFTTFCSLSDCDFSDIMASPKYPRSSKALSSTKDRQSVCSMLSMSSSLCGLDIVHETSMGIEATYDKFPTLGQSGSSEAPASVGMFKPLRSELSLNSLGLSMDSLDALGVGENHRDLYDPVPGARNTIKRSLSPRDLFTPPVGTDARTSKQMLSPPPLKCRENSPTPFNTYQRWS